VDDSAALLSKSSNLEYGTLDRLGCAPAKMGRGNCHYRTILADAPCLTGAESSHCCQQTAGCGAVARNSSGAGPRGRRGDRSRGGGELLEKSGDRLSNHRDYGSRGGRRSCEKFRDNQSHARRAIMEKPSTGQNGRACCCRVQPFEFFSKGHRSSPKGPLRLEKKL